MLGTQRMRIGMLLAVAPIIPALLWATLRDDRADPPNVRLQVSLSARTLKVIEKGRVVRTYGVAVGRPRNPTPTGSFRTGRIVWNPSWQPPRVWWARNKRPQPPGAPENPMQGVKIYFRAPDYYIHGTNNPGSIGSAASHGCIRMTEGDAKALARRIQKAGGSVPLLIKH
jgi:lipoprotein-anchoring transpeptidase ErfK/SrfK